MFEGYDFASLAKAATANAAPKAATLPTAGAPSGAPATQASTTQAAPTVQTSSSPAASTTPNGASATPTSSGLASDKLSYAALNSSPNIDSYIKNYLGGTPTGLLTGDGHDTDQILRDHPDVYTDFFGAYNDPLRNDKNSTALLNKLGTISPEGYAKYWYESMGGRNSYANQPATTGPSTPAPPPTGVDATPVGTGATDGGGLSTGSTSANRDAALAQALSRAKLAVTGRGLDWNTYADQFTPMYQDIYKSIPDSDTNPNAWFDPNMANTILGGMQSRAQSGYRQQALGLPSMVDTHMLDGTINSILGQQSDGAQTMLDNGLKRGQYNETGYSGGQKALAAAKEAAKSKLYSGAASLTGNYNTQLKDIQKQALDAASGYQLGDTFDLSPYATQEQQIMDQFKNAGAGDLYNLMGDAPLIDLGNMRMAAGTAQGSVNLNDLDVLDALSKRKTANDAGRGLGSQGSF